MKIWTGVAILAFLILVVSVFGGSLIAVLVSGFILAIGVGMRQLHRKYDPALNPAKTKQLPQIRDTRGIPQDVKIAVTTRDGGKCRICGSQNDLQFDHIYPWSAGGSSHDPNNIQILCKTCNLKKGARVVGQSWYPYVNLTGKDYRWLTNAKDVEEK